jgi:predicted PurR-regulated permease PerM
VSETTERGSGLYQATAWVLLALGLGALLTLAKEVLAPIALATLLSFALSPVVRALQKVGAPRALGSVVVVAVFLCAIAFGFWLISGQVSDLAAQLPSYQHNIVDKVHRLASMFAGGKGDGIVATVEATLKEATPAEPAKDAPQRVVVVDNSPFARISVLGSFASPLLSPLGQFAIVMVFAVFLLAAQEDLRNRLIKLIGPHDIYRTTEAIDDAGQRVGRMLFAQVVLNSAFGVLIGVGLYFIGAPNPALFGALAGVARFVPYIGVLIGVIPPLVVAFGFDPGWTTFLWTLALFGAAEAIAGQVIEPVVYGHSSGLSPVAVVISASIWAFLWGPIGLVLATPLTTCLVVLGRHVPGLAFLETLLGDAPPLAAHETFYQRMLAGDPREATAQARAFLKRGAIADFYDEVAFEALRRAHVDVARGDLDEARLAAMTQSMRQLVEWLGDSKEKAPARWRALLKGVTRLGREAPDVSETRQDSLLLSKRAAAVLYGDHPLDPVAASMLRHALTRRGLPSQMVSPDEAAAATPAQCEAIGLVCLCYLEPLTLAHLRLAVRAVRRRCPTAKVMICVWRDPGDDAFQGLESKLRCDAVATGVADAGAKALRLVGPRPRVRRRWRQAQPAAA